MEQIGFIVARNEFTLIYLFNKRKNNYNNCYTLGQSQNQLLFMYEIPFTLLTTAIQEEFSHQDFSVEY